jgi:hypothetical protein
VILIVVGGVKSRRQRPNGVAREERENAFGLHNFRYALATAQVKMRVDAKTVQGILRHEGVGLKSHRAKGLPQSCTFLGCLACNQSEAFGTG